MSSFSQEIPFKGLLHLAYEVLPFVEEALKDGSLYRKLLQSGHNHHRKVEFHVTSYVCALKEIQ